MMLMLYSASVRSHPEYRAQRMTRSMIKGPESKFYEKRLKDLEILRLQKGRLSRGLGALFKDLWTEKIRIPSLSFQKVRHGIQAARRQIAVEVPNSKNNLTVELVARRGGELPFTG